MELKLSNNLFLGLQELMHLKESLKESGYEKIFQQMISSYGIVRPFGNSAFENLQVLDSGLGEVTIKAGIAIDNDLNVIEVKTDLIDEVSVPDDNVSRYIVISFAETVIEEGTVNIQVDGSISGSGTSFIKRLRGLPNFPSKIIFPDSTNNVQEYTIQAVQDDTLASLNVAGSQIVAETNQRYAVVGTFTPGVSVATDEKFPFISDGYKIELRSDDTVIEGEEFLLAQVTNDGGVVEIVDQRIRNIFNYTSSNLDALNSVSIESDIIACTEVKYVNSIGSVEKSEVKIEWGIRSNSWNLDINTRKLTVFDGAGGTWSDLSGFAADDFVGHSVVFENGQTAEILSSSDVGGNMTLELEYQSTYITAGEIVITPPGTMELLIKDQSKNYTYQKYLSSLFGVGYIELPPGQYNVKYRLIEGDNVSAYNNINNHQYLKEDSFNANGFVITGSEQYTTYTGGLITVQTSSGSLFTILNAIVFPGVVWDYHGDLTDLPEGWALCDGSLINFPGSPFHNTNAPDYRKRTSVGFDQDTPDYSSVGNVGGVEKVTLTEAQIANHAHNGTVTLDPHSHPIRFCDGAHFDSGARNPGGKGEGGRRTMDERLDIRNSEDVTVSGSIDISSSGGGQEHENRMPFITAYKIMKL